MLQTIFAKKIGMTAKYTSAGKRMGATVLVVPQMKLSGVRTMDKNGYTAIQVQVGKKKQEVRTEEADLLSLAVGTELDWAEFTKVGDKLHISGISKGHGFTGVVKAYKFKGGPRTHGQSDRERARGSSGSTTTPGRVYKGKKMAGRMGNDKVTIKNLRVLEVNPESRQIVVGGSIPGKVTGLVMLSKV